MSKQQLSYPQTDFYKTSNTAEYIENISGGRVTISPPSNVKILSSGIDSLSISLQTVWLNFDLFDYLARLKEKAKLNKTEVNGVIQNATKIKYHFLLPPSGGNGYEYILIFKNLFTIKIMNAVQSKTRPGIFVDFRSEYLWSIDPYSAVNSMIELLSDNGVSILEVKASRIDLCVDVKLPLTIWQPIITDNAVCRARDISKYYSYDFLSGIFFNGIKIGKGTLSARLYDKPLEIKQKSKKYWFFDTWGMDINDLLPDERIIRVEFQLRREAIMQLNNNSIFEVLDDCTKLWGYCTKKWLKFQTNPGKHHTQRKTLDWWVKVQNGFNGIQNPFPAIRNKAIRIDIKQLFSQAYGLLTSLQAATNEEKNINQKNNIDLQTLFSTFAHEMKENEKYDFDIHRDVMLKRSKFQRASKELLQTDSFTFGSAPKKQLIAEEVH